MAKISPATIPAQPESPRSAHFDMETLIGYILLGGTLLSSGLIVAGLAWHWAATSSTQLAYSLAGMNLFNFILSDVRQLAAGGLRPRMLINLGMAALLLTPYLRVLASMLYFAAVERNLKYTLFTGFVFSILTYSLFLR